MKNFYIIAKFGKGRKIRLNEYNFKTREGAERFGRIFLRFNPMCTSYTIYERLSTIYDQLYSTEEEI